MRHAKIRIRLRIGAIWSLSSLGAFLIAKDTKFIHMRTTKSLIRLRGCAVWFESLLGAYGKRYFSDIAHDCFIQKRDSACGIYLGCFHDCADNGCKFLVTWAYKPEMDAVDVSMNLQLEDQYTTQWFALAFSSDKYMVIVQRIYYFYWILTQHAYIGNRNKLAFLSIVSALE